MKPTFVRILPSAVLWLCGFAVGAVSAHYAGREAYVHTRALADRYAEERDSARFELNRRAPILEVNGERLPLRLVSLPTRPACTSQRVCLSAE